MKVLSFGVLYFKLPDDFEGGFSDALRAFADYHDNVTGTPRQSIGPTQDAPDDIDALAYEHGMWDRFCQIVGDTDCHVYGCAALNESPDDCSEPIPLDINTGKPE